MHRSRRKRRFPMRPEPSSGGVTFPEAAEVLAVLKDVRCGDFSVRMSGRGGPFSRTVAATLNSIIQMNAGMVREFKRVRTLVGEKGDITQRAALAGAGRDWASALESINALIMDLAQPTAEV